MRLFFCIFVIFLFFLPGFPELASCPGGEKVSPRYSAAAKNDGTGDRLRVYFMHEAVSTPSILFTARVRQLIRNLYKDRLLFSPLTLQADKKAWKKGEELLKTSRNNGTFSVTIPRDLFLVYHDRTTLHKAVSLSLLASCQLPLRHEEALRKSFLVAGIVHESLNHAFLHTMPYGSNAPNAAVLAGYGNFPGLKKLLTIPLSPEKPSGDLYGEYAWLLLSGLLRNKLLSGEDFLFLTKEIAAKGASSQYELTVDLLNRKLENSKKQLTAEEWFRQWQKKELTGPMLPASPHYIEQEYTRTARLSGLDHAGKKCSFPVTKTADAIQKLQDPDREIYTLLQTWLRLARVAPGELRNKLLAMRKPLIRLRNFPTKENQILLNRKEQEFFLELEKTLKLERFLTSTERFATTEGTRFFRTMEVLEKFHASREYIPWGSRLEDLLTNTQKSYSEEKRDL